ncbi:MAG TPA: hypothetical protein VGD43_20735, partial [Micromonospora sp.]
MPRPNIARSPRNKLLSVVPLGLVLVAAGAFVYVSRTPDSPFDPKLTPISIEKAVERYRADPGPEHSEITLQPASMPVPPAENITGFTPPEPGVYVYATEGGDWVEYNGQNYKRDFPKLTAGTVRRGPGCSWELAFQAAEEYSDGHSQCSAKGQFLCLAHIQKITFDDVSRAMTHTCNPGMVQVGGAAVGPGGQNTAICHAGEHDPSEILITFKGVEQVTVEGQTRQAYHVVLDSKVEGEVKGTAVADVWFDTETGTYLK